MELKDHGLRGSVLENLINTTNDAYFKKGLAAVQKIPTPIKPIEVDNKNHTISKAFFDQKSTVDYIGVVQGYPVCFDAKETSTSNFPLKNVHEHQFEFMKAFQAQNGISFILVYFKTHNEIFFLPFEELSEFWIQSKQGGRRSIPYTGFNRDYLVANRHGFLIHYLEAIDTYLQRYR